MTSTSQRSQELRSAETVREIYELNGVFFDDDVKATEANSKARARQRAVMGLDGTPSFLPGGSHGNAIKSVDNTHRHVGTTNLEAFIPPPGSAAAGSEPGPLPPTSISVQFTARRGFLMRRRAQAVFITKESSEDAVDIRGTANVFDPIYKMESTIGVTAVKSIGVSSAQTPHCRQVNAAVQVEPTIVDAAHNEPGELKDPRTGITVDSARVKKFLDRVIPRTMHHLSQNEEMNIFQDDYLRLMDDDTFIGNREDSFLLEKGNFSHVLTRGRQVSCVDWHSSRPRDDTVVVSTTAILPLQERLEAAGSCKPNLSLVWDLNDPMHPKYILESPNEVVVVRYNPSRPNIIVGGSVNGQVVVWDTDIAQDSAGSNSNRHPSAGGGGAKARGAGGRRGTVQSEDVRAIPPMDQPVKGRTLEQDGDTIVNRLQPILLSKIETMHKKTVRDICWVPDSLEFAFDGKLITAPNASHNQFVTVGDDGTITVWDLRPEHLPQDRLRKMRHQSKSGGDGKLWVPLFKHQLSRPDGSGDVLATAVVMEGRKDGQASYKLAVGSLEGELCFCSVAPKEERLIPSAQLEARDVKRVVREVVPAHACAITAMQPHPQIKGVYLTAGDWGFKVWRTGLTSPVITSPSNPSKITCARWSPTRASVILVGTEDGNVQVWDLLDRSHEPVLVHQLIQDAVTCIEFKPVPDKRSEKFVQYLLLGTKLGSFHWYSLPRVFSKGPHSETATMEATLERETKRVAFVQWRWTERQAEAEKKGGVAPGTNEVVAGGGKKGARVEEDFADSDPLNTEYGDGDIEAEREFVAMVEKLAENREHDEDDE